MATTVSHGRDDSRLEEQHAGLLHRLIQAAATRFQPRRSTDLANDKFTDALERELLDREMRARYW